MEQKSTNQIVFIYFIIVYQIYNVCSKKAICSKRNKWIILEKNAKDIFN